MIFQWQILLLERCLMLGIDLVQVSRLKLDDKFIGRIAHDDEIAYIKKGKSESLQRQRLAALWAVKEAVMKALSLGEGSGVSFKDIKLCHQPNGKPYVELFGVALQEMHATHYGKQIEVSISHTAEYATAIAMIV